jgi:cytochrome c peroxidase
LATTGPYFHAGQFNSLGEAIDFYDERRGSSNPNVASSALDEALLNVPEMDNGRGAIIQGFLNALNDDSFDKRVPDSVPSGLAPGGF